MSAHNLESYAIGHLVLGIVHCQAGKKAFSPCLTMDNAQYQMPSGFINSFTMPTQRPGESIQRNAGMTLRESLLKVGLKGLTRGFF